MKFLVPHTVFSKPLAWLMWDRNIMFIYLTNACEMYNYTLGILKKWSAKSEQRHQINVVIGSLHWEDLRQWILNTFCSVRILYLQKAVGGTGGTEAYCFVSVQIITSIFFLLFSFLVQHTFLRGWELKIFSKAFMNLEHSSQYNKTC